MFGQEWRAGRVGILLALGGGAVTARRGGGEASGRGWSMEKTGLGNRNDDLYLACKNAILG